MQSLADNVLEWISLETSPTAAEFFAAMVDSEGLYPLDEGPYWDFKAQWPFSLSDDYFAGIARLVCAFSNTSGGVIVFGVHDQLRTGGHNKVIVNFDKFRKALNQCLSEDVDLAVHTFKDDLNPEVKLLIVPPRKSGTSPLRPKIKIGKYNADTIWIRSGHEVTEANPTHFATLFCRAIATSRDTNYNEIDGSLPPNPATIKRFIGRVKVLDKLFDWLQQSDEPRCYLYGKGGSGKSTIAFEFARLIREFGTNIKIHGGHSIDSIIYLTAKEKSLSTSSGSTIEDFEPDFSNEAELYKQILFHGRWITQENQLDSMSVEQLRIDVKELLNIKSMLIVIDDIDTLTTKGIDPGSDYLYRTICRSSIASKIIYTIRNSPTQSLMNSIEVPGLSKEEYGEFVAECAKQFGVPLPGADFINTRLISLSEMRPLVIESIIALHGTTGSYARAADTFEQHAGENVRDYVFSREWNALPLNVPARLLLAALVDLDQPSTFIEIETVLQNEESRVRDAIGAVREMFLQIDQTGDETLFSLAPLTKSFIKSKRESLSGYGVLKERVKAYRRNVNIANPQVASEIMRVERLFPPRLNEHDTTKANEVWLQLSQHKGGPKIQKTHYLNH